jgi:hypothetical protein
MQTSPALERDDIDRWISWVLTGDSRNARPSEQVWQRIVHQVVNVGGTERPYSMVGDRSPGVAIRQR